MTETAHPNAPPPEDRSVPAKSGAANERSRMDALMAAVESRAEMLTTLLAETGISFERFLEVFRRALIRNPDLIEADAGSVVEACINACTDGLLPDGRQGAIVVYNVNVANRRKKEPDRWVQKANWQPMYQGLLDIAYSSGNFQSIECRVVYDGDTFEYDLGDEPFIKHRPKPRLAGKAQPPIVAAYAVAKTVNGGVFREVFEGADIEKVNKVSKAAHGPGSHWPEEMARKGPLRRMWKFLPKNEAMNRIVERDNEGFDLAALEVADTGPVREKRLSAGFAEPAQLTQGADPVMPEMGGEEGEMVRVDQNAENGGQSEASHGKAEEKGSRPTEPEVPKAGKTFLDSLATATSWLNVKQALKTFAKTDQGAEEAGERASKVEAWRRMGELREAGKDKTDFVTDPLLFECWLLGAEPAPDPDAVEGNWAIVQADKAFEKLAEEDRARITERVNEAMRADDGAGRG